MAKRGLSKCIGFLLCLTLLSAQGSKLSPFPLHGEGSAGKIIPGAASVKEYKSLLKGKRVGLVVNHSSMIGNTHVVDSFIKMGIVVRRIFTPEHGFRGLAEAGKHIEDGRDGKTGLPIVSLYGKKKKPAADALIDLDYVVFDIQDVGVRFYTYISTLHYVLEACAETGIPVLVLDRPNPLGRYIDGPVLDTAFRSFVGLHPIPIVYGMTIGELARMMVGECWIKSCGASKLKVIPCKYYRHSSHWALPVKPSPNLPNELAIELYPSLCFFEGTTISVGRGTDFPFQVYGHPQFYGEGHFQFIPEDRLEAANPPWEGRICKGVRFLPADLEKVKSGNRIQLGYLLHAYQNTPKDTTFFLKSLFFDKLAGTDQLRKQILENQSEDEIRASWQKGLRVFKAARKKYLLYPE